MVMVHSLTNLTTISITCNYLCVCVRKRKRAKDRMGREEKQIETEKGNTEIKSKEVREKGESERARK